jgi:hypothetical protein
VAKHLRVGLYVMVWISVLICASGARAAGNSLALSALPVAPTDGTPITLTATASEANPGHTYEVFIH